VGALNPQVLSFRLPVVAAESSRSSKRQQHGSLHTDLYIYIYIFIYIERDIRIDTQLCAYFRM